MLRQLNRLFLLASLGLGAQSALAFSLIGPINEGWQAPEIGYGVGGDLGAPKNIGEEYRRNTPVLYYTMDVNFIEYFGTNGMKAIDDAFAVFNALTNVSSYSRELTEFPLAVTRENYQASALGLLDVKSSLMHVIVEQLGLADPERFVWTLHDRFDRGPAPCPATMEYFVVKRNWDLVPSPLNQLQSSSYVNGTLYSYYILEFCDPPNPLADAVEFAVDPLDFTYTTVASGTAPFIDSLNPQISLPGFFYTGLTRDDVGGLRYLMRRDNYNWEDPGTGTFSLITNTSPQLIFSSNLTQLAALALTNSPAALQALYPGLVISSSTNYFRTEWVTTTIPYFTNSPLDPATALPRLLFATNRVLTIQNVFEHTFDNLVAPIFTNGQWVALPIRTLNDFTNAAIATLETINISATQSPFAPAGSFVVTTNVASAIFSTNTVVGEFIILPTNACELVILGPQLTFTNYLTNIISFTTNVVTVTNNASGTNVDIPLIFSQQVVESGVNHLFLTLPVACVQSNIVLAGGVERIRFERRDFDSLIGRFFQPFTNEYTLNVITNNRVSPMRVQRPVFTPDFLISAGDQTPGPAADPLATFTAATRNMVFNTNGLPFYATPSGVVGGPGTIEGPVLFTLNKGGPVYFNQDPLGYDRFQAEASQLLVLNWGSFDGSTNVPVVYPNGESFASLENYFLMHISPGLLPQGTVGVELDEVSFSVLGGQAPYTWALSPGSPGLPPGLTLTSAGVLSGTPNVRGTFDFVIRMTDATGRFVDRAYVIKINW